MSHQHHDIWRSLAERFGRERNELRLAFRESMGWDDAQLDHYLALRRESGEPSVEIEFVEDYRGDLHPVSPTRARGA